jgi:hypothetical protein
MEHQDRHPLAMLDVVDLHVADLTFHNANLNGASGRDRPAVSEDAPRRLNARFIQSWGPIGVAPYLS